MIGHDLLMVTSLFGISRGIVSWTGDRDSWGGALKVWSGEEIDALGLEEWEVEDLGLGGGG